MHTVTAPDGTPIACDRTGTGDALVLVAGAFSYRRYPGQVKLAGHPLPAGQWASATMPALVMCGTEKESPPFIRHASAAVAGALPDGRLVVRRGLGHTKKLTPEVIAAVLTEFLTSPARPERGPGPGASDHGQDSSSANGRTS